MFKKIVSVVLAVSVFLSSEGSIYAADFQNIENQIVRTQAEQSENVEEVLLEESEDDSVEEEVSTEETETEPLLDEDSEDVEITETYDFLEDETQTEEVIEVEETDDSDEKKSDISLQFEFDPANAEYYEELPDGTYSFIGFGEPERAKNTVVIENKKDRIVTKIGESAFDGTDPDNVILPDTVTEIGDRAFYNCANLTSVNTPSELKIIGKEAFSGTSVQKFDFSNVEEVRDRAFYNSTLSEMEGNITKLRIIGKEAFYDRSFDVYLPSTVVKVGSKAFANKKEPILGRKVVICGDIPNFAEDAFEGTKVKSLSLGKDVKDLPESLMPEGKDRTIYSQLESVKIEDGNEAWESEDGVWYSKGKTTLLKYPCKKTKLNKYEIPSTVTTIREYAFQDANVGQVVIPESVTTIGKSAFQDCKATNINIPSGLKKIADYSFAAPLTEITIPENVTEIGEGAFANGMYTGINIPNSVKKVGKDAFSSRNKIETIFIGKNLNDISNLPDTAEYVVSEENQTFSSEEGVLFSKDGTILEYYPLYKKESSYKVPDTVKSIRFDIRWGINLESLAIGDGIKKIPVGAFSWNDHLQSVVLGRNVEEIGYHAFYQVTALKTLTINSDIDEDQLKDSMIGEFIGQTTIKIGHVRMIAPYFYTNTKIAAVDVDEDIDAVVKVDGVFYSKDMTRLIKYDPNLTASSFSIPDTVRYIAPYAFCNCRNLKSLVLNSNIEEIGKDAFLGSHVYIEDIYIGKNVTQIPSELSNLPCTSIKILEENDSLLWEDGILFTRDRKTLVKYPTSRDDTEYVIPDTVTTIGAYAFSNTNLQKVTIPEGVTDIPGYAFYNSKKLQTVTVKGKIQSIGDHAFHGCLKYKGDIDFTGLNYIGKYAFANCASISGTLKIQNTEQVAAHAFENCTGITGLELTDLNLIGTMAFAGCKNVTSIILNNIGTVEENAFSEIAPKILHLGNVTMPEELEDHTENLIDFSADKDNTSVSNTDGVILADNGKTLIKYSDNTGRTSYKVPATVEKIGRNAFRNQKNLKKIVLPNALKEIGDYAFYGCSGLTEINIPESLQKIGAYAFYQCKGVTGKVTLPEMVTIGEYAFYDCAGITEIEIGKDGVTSKTRSIGAYAFGKCSNVGNIIFHGDAPDIAATAFQNVTGMFKYDPAGNGWASILARLAAATVRISENTYCERAVVLVVDCSGSMEGEPISALKTAISTFCSGILEGETDTQVMVIKYSDATDTYGFTSDLDGIIRNGTVSANGGTNTAAAIRRVGACLDGIDAAKKDILIMSDGMPNSEADAIAEFEKLNLEYRVSSMGFFHSLSGSDLTKARAFMKKLQNMGYYEVTDISALNYAFKNTANTVISPLKVVITDSVKTIQDPKAGAYVEATIKGVITNKSKDIMKNIKGSLKVSDDTADLIQNRQAIEQLVPNESAVVTWKVNVPLLPKEQKYDYSVKITADEMRATEFFGKLTVPATDGNSIILEKDLMANPNEAVTVHASIIAADYTPTTSNLTWSVQGNDSGSVNISHAAVSKTSDYVYTASAQITAAKEGTYEITLKADNGTSDSTTLEVKDLYDIANCDITIPECVYNGSAQIPNPTVSRKDGTNNLILAKAQDYTVIYENNTAVGKGTAIVTGAGKYHGTQRVKFNIVPSAVRKLRGNNELSTDAEAYTGAVRNMEIAWDTPLENSLDGYVIWYGRDKKFENYTEQILEKAKQEYSSDSLERASTYYVKVRAYKEIEGERLLGEWSEVLTVKTGRQILVSEMWGLENTRVQIKIGYFYRFCKNNPAYAEGWYQYLGGKFDNQNFVKINGICYGMVLSAAAMKDQKVPLDAYGISDLNEIKSLDQAAEYRSGELNMTARDAMIFAQLTQTDDSIIQAETLNENKLKELHQAVQNCQKGKGSPVTLKLQEGGGNRHEILAVGITEDTEKQVKIAVYDPNRPGDENAELYLFKQNGKFTGYSYTDSTSGVTWASQLNTADDNKDYLSFSTESQGVVAQKLKDIDTESASSAFPNHAIVSATVDEEDEAWLTNQDYGTPLDFAEAAEGSAPISRLWLADKNKVYTFQDVPEDARISAATSNHRITVTTTKQCDLSINVTDNNANDIAITSSEDGSFMVTFKDYTSLSEPAKETNMKVECKAGVTTTIKQTEDSRILLKGAESAAYHRQEGICDTETGLLKEASREELKTPSLDASKSYEIARDHSDVKLSASSKEDDVYDEVIKTIPAEEHAWDSGKITKEANCGMQGEKVYTCEICHETRSEILPATDNHTWGEWTVVTPATVDAPELQQRVCPICGKKETRYVGEKIQNSGENIQQPQTEQKETPKLPFTTNANSLKLKKSQKTTAFKVVSMPEGTNVATVKSSNTKLLKVMKFTKNGAMTLKAQNKTGSAKLTVVLSNGQSKTVTVKIQKGAVKTEKITGIAKKITLKKSKKLKLKPGILPITAVEKITYKSSNSKIVSVDSKGNVKARKKGKATITVKSGKKTAKCTITVK